MKWITGGCHCGGVKIRIQSELNEVYECNCSICMKKAFLHVILKKENFELVSGGEFLTEYTFGTHTAKHLFCKKCGISSFYIPRSHPDGFSVNLRCLDGVDMNAVRVVPFDGKNWEKSVSEIK